MRRAVLEHPRIARRHLDHLQHTGQIKPLRGGKTQRLAHRGDMHTCQQLIDRLHRRSRPGAIAQAMHRFRQCRQHCLCPPKRLGPARCHHRKPPLRRLDGPARDGRIEIEQPPACCLCFHLAGKFRRDRGTAQNDTARLHPFGPALRPKESIARLRGIEHNTDKHLRLGRCPVQQAPTRRNQQLPTSRVRIMTVCLEPGPQGRLRHAKAHRPQPHEMHDLCHCPTERMICIGQSVIAGI